MSDENLLEKSDRNLSGIADRIKDGSLSPQAAAEELLALPYVDGNSVCIDRDRSRRCGFPEVVFGQGKSVDALILAFETLLADHNEAIATRVAPECATRIANQFEFTRWNLESRTLRIGRECMPLAPDQIQSDHTPMVAVVSAGTTDVPIALEAVETLAWMRVPSLCIWDVGVAGPYRLLAHVGRLRSAAAVVVVAGMEGALPSVVGGHVAVPVVAVPTSVGYGASFQGLTALLGMLNSCAANVSVVNIDAGFKGGYVAGLIAHAAGLTQQNGRSQHNPRIDSQGEKESRL